MKRNRNIGSILLIAAGLLLIAAALYELIPALLAYKRADDTYEALREAYVTGQPETSSDDPAEEGEELPAWYEALQVDFETLKEANPDVIGWIYFDNIEQINYPILYSGDDETYLHTDLYGNASKSGCIFMEGNNVPDFNDCHTILYGHNMKNGSMFGSLKQYKNDGFYEKNTYFTVFTEDAAYRYQIFAYSDVPEDSDVYTTGYLPDETFDGFFTELLKSSYKDTGVAVGKDDKVLTLSTCSGDGQTVHEIGIIGQCHLFGIDSPVAVHVKNFAVIGICISRPVFSVDEVRAFECLFLVVFHTGARDEFRVQFVAFRVGNHEFIICCVHPFGKTVRNSLWERFRMRSPSHDDLRTVCLLILFDGDQVGKTLQRMAGSRFHTEYRTTGVLNELIQYLFVVIIFLAFKTSE